MRFERSCVHGERDVTAWRPCCCSKQLSEKTLLAKEIAVEGPEGCTREVGKIDKHRVGVLRGEGEQCRGKRHAPPLQQKRVPGHPIDDALNELQVLQFDVHRSLLVGLRRSNRPTRLFAQVRLTAGLDEAATRNGTPVGEFVSCRHMPQLWRMLTSTYLEFAHVHLSRRVRSERVS